MPFNGPPALPLSGGTVAGNIVIANATDPTKYATEYVDSSGTLTLTNTSAAAMATLSQGGALVTAGLAQVYGATNAVLIQGSADTGQVHLGLTTGLSGKNIGAVLGNVQGTGAIQAQVTDSGVGGGNARGTNAVDWQTLRSAAGQVSSGVSATIGGGNGNTATGTTATVSGGTSNTATATAATVTGGTSNIADGNSSRSGGRSSYAHGIYGVDVFASGSLATSGDAQSGTYVLRGRSTAGAAVRLTADGAAAGSANVANIPTNTAWSGTISVAARDTSTGNCARWMIPFGLAKQGTAASVTLVTGAVDFANIIGAVAATGNLATSADTSAGSPGINLTFTPANANTWDVVAVLRVSEAQ